MTKCLCWRDFQASFPLSCLPVDANVRNPVLRLSSGQWSLQILHRVQLNAIWTIDWTFYAVPLSRWIKDMVCYTTRSKWCSRRYLHFELAKPFIYITVCTMFRNLKKKYDHRIKSILMHQYSLIFWFNSSHFPAWVAVAEATSLQDREQEATRE